MVYISFHSREDKVISSFSFFSRLQEQQQRHYQLWVSFFVLIWDVFQPVVHFCSFHRISYYNKLNSPWLRGSVYLATCLSLSFIERNCIRVRTKPSWQRGARVKTNNWDACNLLAYPFFAIISLLSALLNYIPLVKCRST